MIYCIKLGGCALGPLFLINLDWTLQRNSSALYVVPDASVIWCLGWLKCPRRLTHMVSCQPRPQLGAVNWNVVVLSMWLFTWLTFLITGQLGFKRVWQVHKSRSCRSLKAQPGMLYRSLLPLLIGQSKSQGQSRFKGRKDCTSVWLEPHICAGREGIDGGILGVSLPQWVLYFFTQVRLLVQGHTSNK